MSLHRDENATSLHDVLARHRPRITLAVVLLLLTLLAGTALLGLSGHFLTAAALAGSAAAGFNFFGPSAGIRALTFVRILSRYGEKLLGHDVTLRIARDLRAWFFARALPLAPLGLGRFRVGDLMARLMADVEAIDGLLVRAIGPLLALLSLCLLATAVTLAVLPLAGTVLLVALAAIATLAPWLAARSVAALEGERAQARTRLRATVQEGIEGQQDLVAMDATAAWLAELMRAAARSRAGRTAASSGLRWRRSRMGWSPRSRCRRCCGCWWRPCVRNASAPRRRAACSS